MALSHGTSTQFQLQVIKVHTSKRRACKVVVVKGTRDAYIACYYTLRLCTMLFVHTNFVLY